MAWTANITTVAKGTTGGTATVTVYFHSDSGEAYSQVYNVSDPSQLKRLIADQIAQFTLIDTYVASSPTGPVDITPDVPPPPPTPTAAQVAIATFQKDIALLRQMNSAVQLGFFTQAYAPYQTLVAKIKAEFINPDYLQYLTF